MIKSTATRLDFPIPYAGQAPTDDLFAARSFLRIIHGAIERASGDKRGMSQGEANGMLHVIGVVEDKLDTLQRLLDDKAVPHLAEDYKRVRREELQERMLEDRQ